MVHRVASVFLLAFLATSASAFTGLSRFARVPTFVPSTRDDEIAKLEEQLKRLKDEKEYEEVAEDAKSLPMPSEDDPDAGLDVMFSERWKENDPEQSGEGGFGLSAILGAVGLLAFFAIFSQIPVGQDDLARYSTPTVPESRIDLGDLNRARGGN